MAGARSPLTPEHGLRDQKVRRHAAAGFRGIGDQPPHVAAAVDLLLDLHVERASFLRTRQRPHHGLHAREDLRPPLEPVRDGPDRRRLVVLGPRNTSRLSRARPAGGEMALAVGGVAGPRFGGAKTTIRPARRHLTASNATRLLAFLSSRCHVKPSKHRTSKPFQRLAGRDAPLAEPGLQRLPKRRMMLEQAVDEVDVLFEGNKLKRGEHR